MLKNKFFFLFLFVLLAFCSFLLVKNTKKEEKIYFNSNNLDKEKIVQENIEKNIEKKFENNFYPPILAFHNVSATLKEDKWGLTINTLDLEKKFQQLQEANYQTVFITELAQYIEKGQKIPNNLVALTFDDGTIGFYTEVLPLLKKYQIKASLYIMTGVRSKNYVNAEQIKEIDQTGLVEIGSHTVYHQRLASLSEEEQFKELVNSKKYLENLLQKEIKVLCYPYGSYSEKTKELTKEAGYLYALDFNRSPVLKEFDLWAINRIGLSPNMNIVSILNNLHLKNNLN